MNALKLASLMMALTLLGCTSHTIQTHGQTGVSLGNGRYAFPNAKGELEVGELNHKDLPAGTLVRVPKTEQEVIDALKDAGAKFDGQRD